MNDDELFDKLRHADPARHDAPADSWLDDLVEATMSTTPADGPVKTERRRWIPLAAAAAVVAVAAGAVAVAASRGGSDPAPQAQPPTVTELSLPAEDSMQMCMQVTPEALGLVDMALEGTATEVSEERVVLDVDRWYKGGDTDQVALTPADPQLVALLGAIEFTEGERYLVSAADGSVNSCGFTGPYDSQLAAIYDAAFSG